MKKTIKKLSEPRVEFENWASVNGIEIENKDSGAQKGAKKAFFKSNLFKLAAIASAMVLACIIFLPIILNGGEDAPIVYSSQNAKTKNLSLEELYEIQDLLLFDFDQIFEYRRAGVSRALDNEDLILSYNLTECTVVTKDMSNAFVLDYIIRVYKNFEFFGFDSFFDLEKSFFVGETKIMYEISMSSYVPSALIAFEYEGKEYFIVVRGYEDVTELNDQNIELLINDLFS